eukprot:4060224-Amphidinium_carterae.2
MAVGSGPVVQQHQQSCFGTGPVQTCPAAGTVVGTGLEEDSAVVGIVGPCGPHQLSPNVYVITQSRNAFHNQFHLSRHSDNDTIPQLMSDGATYHHGES